MPPSLSPSCLLQGERPPGGGMGCGAGVLLITSTPCGLYLGSPEVTLLLPCDTGWKGQIHGDSTELPISEPLAEARQRKCFPNTRRRRTPRRCPISTLARFLQAPPWGDYTGASVVTEGDGLGPPGALSVRTLDPIGRAGSRNDLGLLKYLLPFGQGTILLKESRDSLATST